MKKKEETLKINLFQEIFLGEFVQILTPIYQKRIQGDESGVSDETIPIVIEGYVVDIDDVYIYLGDKPTEIAKAIMKEDARHISIVREENPYDKMLDDIPDGGKVN